MRYFHFSNDVPKNFYQNECETRGIFDLEDIWHALPCVIPPPRFPIVPSFERPRVRRNPSRQSESANRFLANRRRKLRWSYRRLRLLFRPVFLRQCGKRGLSVRLRYEPVPGLRSFFDELPGLWPERRKAKGSEPACRRACLVRCDGTAPESENGYPDGKEPLIERRDFRGPEPTGRPPRFDYPVRQHCQCRVVEVFFRSGAMAYPRFVRFREDGAGHIGTYLAARRGTRRGHAARRFG